MFAGIDIMNSMCHEGCGNKARALTRAQPNICITAPPFLPMEEDPPSSLSLLFHNCDKAATSPSNDNAPMTLSYPSLTQDILKLSPPPLQLTPIP